MSIQDGIIVIIVLFYNIYFYYLLDLLLSDSCKERQLGLER